MTENQNELKLLPCPFCGNKPHPVYESHGYTWCENDNCVMWGVGEVFSDQWNTRATSLAERVKELENVLSDWLRCADTPQEWARCRNNAKVVLGESASPEYTEMVCCPTCGTTKDHDGVWNLPTGQRATSPVERQKEPILAAIKKNRKSFRSRGDSDDVYDDIQRYERLVNDIEKILEEGK